VSRRAPWLVVFLVLAVVASGIGVVYAKYLSRSRFVELQRVRAQRDQVDVRWRRLQLEESTLATYSRVEADARGKLRMHLPHPGEVVVVRKP
jgi:cell division protein FtsL